jgi:hypothetical protein
MTQVLTRGLPDDWNTPGPRPAEQPAGTPDPSRPAARHALASAHDDLTAALDDGTRAEQAAAAAAWTRAAVALARARQENR